MKPLYFFEFQIGIKFTTLKEGEDTVRAPNSGMNAEETLTLAKSGFDTEDTVTAPESDIDAPEESHGPGISTMKVRYSCASQTMLSVSIKQSTNYQQSCLS